VAKQSIEALTAEVVKPDWSITLDNYARCVRIVRDLPEALPLDISKDRDPHTQALYQAYETAHQTIGPRSSIEAFFSALAPLIPAIQVFDKVLVMHGSSDPADAAGAAAASGIGDGIVDLEGEGFS
jgi:hypothetical protein